jgi:hypothetical protein
MYVNGRRAMVVPNMSMSDEFARAVIEHVGEGIVRRCCRLFASVSRPSADGLGFFHEDRACDLCGTKLRLVFHGRVDASGAHRSTVVAMTNLR